MKIAIVNDFTQDLSSEIDYIATYISKYHNELSGNLKINGFQSVADFLKFFEVGQFDSVIKGF